MEASVTRGGSSTWRSRGMAAKCATPSSPSRLQPCRLSVASCGTAATSAARHSSAGGAKGGRFKHACGCPLAALAPDASPRSALVGPRAGLALALPPTLTCEPRAVGEIEHCQRAAQAPQLRQPRAAQPGAAAQRQLLQAGQPRQLSEVFVTQQRLQAAGRDAAR